MQDGNNRALILTTARELFEANPGGFTLASLCRLTGISRATLRRHFPTKSALMTWLKDELPFDKAPAEPEIVQTVANADSLAPPDPPPLVESELPPLVIEPPAATPAPVKEMPPVRARSQIREAAQQILAKAEIAQETAPRPQWLEKVPKGPRLFAAAGILCAALIATASVISAGGFARAKQTLAQIPAPAVERRAEIAHKVLVIDATGAAPDPMYQEASPALRDVIVRARRGEIQAQVELAQSFLKGQGFMADPVAAARWSDEAAARGDPTAQFILGTLYAQGIKPNPRLAFDWFSAAASRGDVKAMHNLAIAYLNGAGVTQDAAAAAAWFEKAASAGYRDSAFDLAVLYERGQGVTQSAKDALKWYERAASFGDPEAMQRANYLRSWQVAKR